MQPEIAAPSTVFGLPARNGERHLAEAIESLLAQTRPDFAVLVVDDASTDGTAEVALRYAAADARVSYVRNQRRLGLARNWRRALELAGERFAGASYFAWASDHDVWHPEWLEATAAELDRHPEAVLAYPLAVRIDEDGAEYPTRERPFDTAGVRAPRERLRRVVRDLPAAGELIYGLARRAALERAGPFPLTVLPDRLQLARLALEGEFRQVPRRLWYRRYRAGVSMSNARQRRMSFPGRPPAWAYLHWSLIHPFQFVRARGDLRYAGVVLVESLRHAYDRARRRGRRRRRWARRERRRRLRALLGRGRTGAADRTPTAAVPRREHEGLLALERAELIRSLERPGAVVLDLGSAGLARSLARRFPGLRVVEADPRGPIPPGRADLALSVGALEGLTSEEAEMLAARLHQAGAVALYSLDVEAPHTRQALGRHYWLHDLWLTTRRPGAKPDPRTGPVPREPGEWRHLVGRRRLVVARSPCLVPRARAG